MPRTKVVDGIEVKAFDTSVYLTTDSGDGSQYCLSVASAVRALVGIDARTMGNISTEPQLRRYGSCSDTFTSDTQIGTRKYTNGAPNDTHDSLARYAQAVAEAVESSDYWHGYNDGSDEATRDVAERAVISSMEFTEWDMLRIGEMFAEMGIVPSNRSNACFPIPKWGRSEGSYVANISAHEAGKCANCGSPLSQTRTVVESPNTARLPNKYRCTNCDHRWKGIASG